MEVIFLGTGTSQGVPVIGCNCKVCISKFKKDKRLRASIFIKIKKLNIMIDAGPDFRQQILRENICELNAILFTHEHIDHIGGLDDVRAFNFLTQKPMEIYAEQEVQEAIKKTYYYIYSNKNYPSLPKFNFNTITENSFFINGIKISPIRVMHDNLSVLGFRINDLTYITDANHIDKKEIEKIKGSKILIINALRHKKHNSHFNLEEAINISKEIKPKKTYLTHISHNMGNYSEISANLPKNVFLAYDRLKFSLK